jgi:lysine 2,3-aminomutase
LADPNGMNFNAPRTLKTPGDLAAAGLISPGDTKALVAVAAKYAIAVSPALQELMVEPGIARQFLPTVAELDTTSAERADPIGDHSHSPAKGIVHRYPDRVLLMPTLACAVYCRFCFRRESVGDKGLSAAELENALAYIQGDARIWEVILTGGDPLVLSARRLGDIVAALNDIEHVKVLRIHTRVPVAAPEMIDAELIAVLRQSTKTVYLGVHCNHPAELTGDAKAALARLADAGIPLLAQTVLLKDVNDNAETLDALFRALVEARVRPYYLHQLDLAPGTSHFRVPLERGQELVKGLRGRLSGIALPTYILDIPGGAGKVPATNSYISPEGDGSYLVRDNAGEIHTYRPCE